MKIIPIGKISQDLPANAEQRVGQAFLLQALFQGEEIVGATR
jgi:hypothetical protein